MGSLPTSAAGRSAIELVMALRMGEEGLVGRAVSDMAEPLQVLIALAAMVNVLASDEQMAEFGRQTVEWEARERG